jgi:hypothetical protein
MADEAVTLREINWREAFPFTNLFRAFRIAIHPSKLIIALLALACLWCGGKVLDAVWPAKYQASATDLPLVSSDIADAIRMRTEYLDQMLHAEGHEPKAEAPAVPHVGIFHKFFNFEVVQANSILMFRGGAYETFESAWQFVAVGPLWLWSSHWVFALLYTSWFLLIWSVFGGAISRIAAVHVARDEKISVRQAVSFSVSKVLSFICAPIIPVLIILIVGVIIAIAATILLHIPYVGPPIAAFFFFLALLGGFIITLVLLGTLGGFNLMYPTVAVEGSDSFDAISRSFSYVFARPWRMLFYTLVSIVYGGVCYLFVRFFVWMVLAVTWFFMTWFLGPNGQPAKYFPMMWPQPTDPLKTLTYMPAYDTLKGSEALAAGLMSWWIYLVIGLVGAFAISFYFSSNTLIYYLMRREVDATDLDDVYVEEMDDEIPDTEASPVITEMTPTIVEGTPPTPPTGA